MLGPVNRLTVNNPNIYIYIYTTETWTFKKEGGTRLEAFGMRTWRKFESSISMLAKIFLQMNRKFNVGYNYCVKPCHHVTCHSHVCLSQVSVLMKELNVGSCKQCYTIAQGL